MYFLLFLLVFGIEPPNYFTQNPIAASFKRLIHCTRCPCRTIQNEFLKTYKPNVSINSWDTTLNYDIQFFTLAHILIGYLLFSLPFIHMWALQKKKLFKKFS